MYKNVCKDVFVNGHERSDIVENCANFLKKIEELKSYMVEFFEDGAMKPKVYPSNYVIEGENCQPIILITHDKCIFSANNGVQKSWT